MLATGTSSFPKAVSTVTVSVESLPVTTEPSIRCSRIRRDDPFSARAGRVPAFGGLEWLGSSASKAAVEINALKSSADRTPDLIGIPHIQLFLVKAPLPRIY